MTGRRKASPVRPRYGRIALAATSTTVTAIAVLGAAGALPSAAHEPAREGAIASVGASSAEPESGQEGDPAPSSSSARQATGPKASQPATAGRDTEPAAPQEPAVPAGSGHGRRVVFSEGEQRVWLVGGKGEVRRTYLVSGSIYDNLDPGTYSVYSRSEQAWGIDDSGSMRYFVRFAQGDNAAIGFHDIPVDEGARVQTVAELGTPLSHGCIRQRSGDARAMWAFAPLGTKVVVTA